MRSTLKTVIAAAVVTVGLVGGSAVASAGTPQATADSGSALSGSASSALSGSAAGSAQIPYGTVDTGSGLLNAILNYNTMALLKGLGLWNAPPYCDVC
ncbi:hypothetical protein [Nocardia sp. NPDC006630]|uniref:hypothetical protein n=1 Tax=Nocardia sp. NPDC006630 TaxID=3157181 RepID=UPI0033A8EF75